MLEQNWWVGQQTLITGGNGKFLSGPAVVNVMVCGETGFPLWNKASVELLWTKIACRLLETSAWRN